jgi:hypothetical protein
MSLLMEQSRSDVVGTDTQPFDFIGRDSWGGRVRGSVVALDAADAFATLLARRIEASAVNAHLEAAAPYTVELTVLPRAQSSVAGLVRRVMAKNAAN